MIDLHSHILPGIDDGARTLDEALAMARLAAADGIRVLVATPHSPASSASHHYDPAQIRVQCQQLNQQLQAEGLALEVLPGTEITYTADIATQLRHGKLLALGHGRTILLELISHTLPVGFDEVLFRLQIEGWRVLLAHPERIGQVQQNPGVLRPLVERGLCLQITAVALLGTQTAQLQRTAEALLRAGLVHAIASDAHGIAPRRPPGLAAARAHAAALLGNAAATALVETNPAALLRPRMGEAFA